MKRFTNKVPHIQVKRKYPEAGMLGGARAFMPLPGAQAEALSAPIRPELLMWGGASPRKS